MKKIFQIAIFLIIIALIVGLIFIVKAKKKEFSESSKEKASGEEILKDFEGKLVYFYGDGCPHCANVEKFFEENEIKSKIQFEEKEIYNDKGNAKLLILLAKNKCGLKENEIGVPFLWEGENSKCILGDQPIIDYFKEKIAI